MQQIFSKLSVSEIDLSYHYLINDVSLGLELALKQKNVIKNKDTYSRLKKLSEIVNKLSMPIWKEIDLEDQLTAYHISCDSLEILEEMIN